MRRYFIALRSNGYLYDGQPGTGFSSEVNAHNYAERKTLLTPDRYDVIAREMRSPVRGGMVPGDYSRAPQDA